MIKRPINERFVPKVLAGQKVTTLREHAWPLCSEIMLYRWDGRAYHSPQIDVAVVKVISSHHRVLILRSAVSGRLDYTNEVTGGLKLDPVFLNRNLWELEGFDSQADMDAWFKTLVKPGRHIFRAAMHFELVRRVEGGTR